MASMKIAPKKLVCETHLFKQPTLSAASLLSFAVIPFLFSHSPLKATGTDEQIEVAAKSSYVFRTFLQGDSITTTSKDGVVTLAGSVKESSHKQLAEDTMIGLPGVKSVINQIETKDSPPENSDTWLYLKVKSTLAYHRSVSAFNTQVEIKEGVAILKGEASSQAQKDLVTEYTKDVVGIKGVQNDMTITNPAETKERTVTEIIDDASITAQVRMALLSHRSTSNLRTTVSTKDGIVAVGSKANNMAEIDLVTKIVTDINGVKGVVNDMSIAVAAAAN
jgi:hyperosmotically inducible periplasmic protein